MRNYRYLSGNLVGGAEFQIIDLDILPESRKKGAKPVLSEHAELISNSISGSLATQSVWVYKNLHATCSPLQVACSWMTADA